MRALIVDDDEGILWVLDKVLREEGLDVSQAGSIAEAQAVLNSETVDMVFLDVFLPDGNGMNLLASGTLTMPVVMLTAETTFGHAAEAYRIGAMEYLPKPFDLDEVRQLVQRVRPVQKKAGQQQKQKKDLIIGRSPAMQQLFRTLGRVAASDLTVLITGESGTGKEMVAQTLHERSQRAERPFVAINTAAIPADLLESELFGHEKGAFTGADRGREGRFEQADGGTLFLDEIGDMPAALQAKLLRVLEEGRVQRVGGGQSKVVNVRLLAATHQHLPEKIAKGTFREDLYYRLNVIPVHIPPLRERRDDIRELAHHLLAQVVDELDIKAPVISGQPRALPLFKLDTHWRELRGAAPYPLPGQIAQERSPVLDERICTERRWRHTLACLTDLYRLLHPVSLYPPLDEPLGMGKDNGDILYGLPLQMRKCYRVPRRIDRAQHRVDKARLLYGLPAL